MGGTADVKEKYRGKNCQTPNTATYYKVPKVDCTCCKGSTNKDYWMGVMQKYMITDIMIYILFSSI